MITVCRRFHDSDRPASLLVATMRPFCLVDWPDKSIAESGPIANVVAMAEARGVVVAAVGDFHEGIDLDGRPRRDASDTEREWGRSRSGTSVPATPRRKPRKLGLPANNRALERIRRGV